VAWVANSVGYASASDLRVHYGLGEVSQVEEIEIAWPSGHVQRIRDIAADQILRIVESPKR
jgi:hypothetical protein